jgi:hypothetical protein
VCDLKVMDVEAFFRQFFSPLFFYCIIRDKARTEGNTKKVSVL